jgi:hypothetical protein
MTCASNVCDAYRWIWGKMDYPVKPDNDEYWTGILP